MFTLRDQSPRRIVFIGGGAGMAPILCLLRSLQERGIERDAVYYYGARTETDLFHREELEALASALPSFHYVPALSHAEWGGEAGMITDVVERLEEDLKDVDAYVCGPPPMVEAAQGLLMAKGVPESRIYFDKFTTTETEETSRT
jgi:propane monooxygenase reductase subunit